jgi:hypothetical protein
LKKRTKKLLDIQVYVSPPADSKGKSFLLLFFKKEVLPYAIVCALSPAPQGRQAGRAVGGQAFTWEIYVAALQRMRLMISIGVRAQGAA